MKNTDINITMQVRFVQCKGAIQGYKLRKCVGEDNLKRMIVEINIHMQLNYQKNSPIQMASTYNILMVYE